MIRNSHALIFKIFTKSFEFHKIETGGESAPGFLDKLKTTIICWLLFLVFNSEPWSPMAPPKVYPPQEGGYTLNVERLPPGYL